MYTVGCVIMRYVYALLLLNVCIVTCFLSLCIFSSFVTSFSHFHLSWDVFTFCLSLKSWQGYILPRRFPLSLSFCDSCSHQIGFAIRAIRIAHFHCSLSFLCASEFSSFISLSALPYIAIFYRVLPFNKFPTFRSLNNSALFSLLCDYHRQQVMSLRPHF